MYCAFGSQRANHLSGQMDICFLFSLSLSLSHFPHSLLFQIILSISLLSPLVHLTHSFSRFPLSTYAFLSSLSIYLLIYSFSVCAPSHQLVHLSISLFHSLHHITSLPLSLPPSVSPSDMGGFVEGERTQAVSQGEAAVILTPRILSYPRPQITWFRDGRKIPPSSRM